MTDGGRLPDYVVAGPQRTGTTWLFRCMEAHPQVHVPPEKEVHFFDDHFERGIGWYRQQVSSGADPADVVVDVTPTYCGNVEVPARIRTVSERTKLIFIVRDPVDRAFSHYLMKARTGQLRMTFAEALKEDPSLVQNSLYHANIQRYRQYFEDSAMALFDFGWMRREPMDAIAVLWVHLGVSAFFPPVVYRRVNQGTGVPDRPLLARWATRFRAGLERTALGRKTIWKLRDWGVAARWHESAAGGGTKPELDQSERDRVFARYFQEDWSLMGAFSHLWLQRSEENPGATNSMDE